MKLKNFVWYGFGFPVIYAELPAIKLRGEWIPDVNWTELGEDVLRSICTEQSVPLSGSQIRFIRISFAMTLRTFATFVGVKHQSVMRWEEKKDQPAGIAPHIEIVLRIKALRKVEAKSSQLEEAIKQIDDVEKFRAATYKKLKPLRVA